MGLKDLVDPLENAKIDSPELVASKKAKKPVVVEEAPPLEKPVVAQVLDNTVRFVVQRDITISWGGQMVRLKEGTVVSDATHGERAMERMQNAGVQLKVVEGK